MTHHHRPSDADRIWKELCERPYRLHSLEMRERGLTGNPSQRIAEIEENHNVQIPRRRERYRNGRWGSMYFHPDHAPAGLGVGGTVPIPSRPEGAQPQPATSPPAVAADPDADTDQAEVTDLFGPGEDRPGVPPGSYRDPDAEGPVAA